MGLILSGWLVFGFWLAVYGECTQTPHGHSKAAVVGFSTVVAESVVCGIVADEAPREGLGTGGKRGFTLQITFFWKIILFSSCFLISSYLGQYK